MRKCISLLLAAMMLLAMASVAGAESEYVYGTMQIPYAEFYAGEGVTDVDAVTSATTGKWNQEDIVPGTYSAAHTDDEGGDILGVVYPVAISQADLDALGEDNYGFAALDEQPAAYKIVTVADGVAQFSAVQGETSVLEANPELSTDVAYGDYMVTVPEISGDDTQGIGTIYGILVKTSDGAVYGMRHLENIWFEEFAWSVGFVTEERHGNQLSYEQYADMMGKTITDIVYITETGYHALNASIYLPVKFDGGVEAADATAASGETAVTLRNVPEDFVPTYSVEGLEIEVTDGVMRFGAAMPGEYSLTVHDESGKYADLFHSFMLSTDVLPVTYDAENHKLAIAEGVDEALAQTFIANISTVSVNGDEYRAAGKQSVAIIDSDGVIDFEAAMTQGRGADAVATPIFPESGEYALVIASTGFDQTLDCTVTVEK